MADLLDARVSALSAASKKKATFMAANRTAEWFKLTRSLMREGAGPPYRWKVCTALRRLWHTRTYVVWRQWLGIISGSYTHQSPCLCPESSPSERCSRKCV